MNQLISCEYVSKGHPDKIADQISDLILDTYLSLDPDAQVGVEVMIKNNFVVLGGEITSTTSISLDSIISSHIKSLGFSDAHNLNKILIINLIGKQCPTLNKLAQINVAGDQSTVVGYATNQTESFLPVEMHLSKEIIKLLETIENIGPDGKCQVVINKFGPIFKAQNISVSVIHDEDLSSITSKIKQAIRNDLPSHANKYITQDTVIKVNPNNTWNIGGPVTDCGVTGRKIVCDHYGPSIPIGGGCLSGKSPNKMDRSGSYLARYIAKNIVASGLYDECLVEISYMIGLASPMSLRILGKRNSICEVFDKNKLNIIEDLFPIMPNDVINKFNLKTPIYLPTAMNGHFGDHDYPWEKVDMVEKLKLLLI